MIMGIPVIICWLMAAVRKGQQAQWIVPDELWARIEPLPPAVSRRADHPGRKRLDNREGPVRDPVRALYGDPVAVPAQELPLSLVCGHRSVVHSIISRRRRVRRLPFGVGRPRLASILGGRPTVYAPRCGVRAAHGITPLQVCDDLHTIQRNLHRRQRRHPDIGNGCPSCGTSPCSRCSLRRVAPRLLPPQDITCREMIHLEKLRYQHAGGSGVLPRARRLRPAAV